eukprot:14351963-Heterocapsa_arctica.AAC.1
MSSMNSSSLVMLGWPSRGIGVSNTHGRPSFVESTSASPVRKARRVPSRTSSFSRGRSPL